MSENPDKTGDAERPALDKTVQDHLGQKLRAAYAEAEDKPAYLGDPALPPELEHKLMEVEKAVEVREKGVEAVKDALGVPDRAHERGMEAVREALGDTAPTAPSDD